MTELIEINELAEYTKHICYLNNADADKIDKSYERKVYLFRGQPNRNYELLPSLARYKKVKHKGLVAYISDLSQIERNLIESAKFKLPDLFSNDLLPVELLSLLQHHGIPTRLLDITENAHVALYFACVSDFEIPGEVIVFLGKEYMIHNHSLINAIADSYRLIKGTFYEFNYFLQNATEQDYFSEDKHVFKTSKLDQTHWVEYCCKELMFIYSPIRTQRQQAQQGRYILFHNKIDECDEKGFCSEIEPIQKDHESIVKRLIIPANKKKDILNELKLFGISKASIFPDSVDKVCKEIKETYF